MHKLDIAGLDKLMGQVASRSSAEDELALEELFKNQIRMGRKERLEQGLPLGQDKEGDGHSANRRALSYEKPPPVPKNDNDESLAPYGGGPGI